MWYFTIFVARNELINWAGFLSLPHKKPSKSPWAPKNHKNTPTEGLFDVFWAILPPKNHPISQLNHYELGVI